MVKNIKMELKDTLRPIERLYLISKEKEDVFNKKNRLYTLLYFYVVNENISIGGDKNIKLNYDGKGFNSTYEELGLDLLKEKKWLDFNTFLDGLHFNKTLVDNGILKMEVKVKKRFFLNLAKNEITRKSVV